MRSTNEFVIAYYTIKSPAKSSHFKTLALATISSIKTSLTMLHAVVRRAWRKILIIERLALCYGMHEISCQ